MDEQRQEELERLAFSHSGLVARSPEGHAARGMNIKGDENLWVGIQKKTFTNWVNEQLRSSDIEVTDLQTDFCNGLKLVALVEVLQKKKLKKIAKPINQHQYLENVQIALNAVTGDGIKLVNIGNTDIVGGNLKLILGLVWSLITRYQIGKSRFPAKKLMLSWLNAALPNKRITNLTSNWNDGINLCALVNYCKPALFPDWEKLDAKDGLSNCQDAMRTAKKEFNVPMILTPEDLSSDNLDELSGMTYLSYFMRPDSPGYFSSLNWVRKQIPHLDIRNFTTDWNDGLALCHLVRSLGASIKGFSNLNKSRKYWEHNLELGIKAGSSVGVKPILTSKEMTDKDVDYLGIMAYVSAFRWVKNQQQLEQKTAKRRITITGTNLNNCHVNKQAHFKVNLNDAKLDVEKIGAKVKGPSSNVDCKLEISEAGDLEGSFLPSQDGNHELVVLYDEEVVDGCPMKVKVHADISKIMFSGIDPCAVGSIVEVLINSKGAGGGAVRVDATAPSDRLEECPVTEEKKGIYMAKFSPNEIGEWKIAVTYGGQHIHGSPFTCYVYNPYKVKIMDLEAGIVDEDLKFVADTTRAGWGDIKIEVTRSGKEVPCQVDERGNGQYRVKFRPRDVGRHKINVSFNGVQIRGSPFAVEVFDSRGSLRSYNLRNDGRSSADSSTNGYGNGYERATSPPRRMEEKSGGYSQSKNRNFYMVSDIKDSNWSSGRIDKSEVKSSDESAIRSRFNMGSSSSDRNEGHLRPRLAPDVKTDDSSKYRNRQRMPSRAQPLPSDSFESDDSGGRWVGNDRKRADSENGDTSDGMPVVDSPVASKLGSSFNSRKNVDRVGSPHRNGNRFDAVKMREEIRSKSEAMKRRSEERKSVVDTSVKSGYVSAIDIDKIVVTCDEDLKLMRVGATSELNVQTEPNVRLEDINVNVTSPSSEEVPIEMYSKSSSMHIVEFVAREVGEHSVSIWVQGKKVKGSPFVRYAYNSDNIKVGRIPNGTVGKSIEFEIDGSSAGSGNLEILVNGGHVTSNVRNLGNHRFVASFVPHSAMMHTIDMKFNGRPVPGSPWMCEVKDSRSDVVIRGEGIKTFSCERPAMFDIVASGRRSNDVQVYVDDPDDRRIKHRLVERPGGRYSVVFNSSKVGVHTIEVNIEGRPISGSPFLSKAYNTDLITVSTLEEVLVDHSSQFIVDASRAGEGQLEISIDDGEVPNEVRVIDGGKCVVTFVPEREEPHKIDIHFNGESVPGSPYVVNAIRKLSSSHETIEEKKEESMRSSSRGLQYGSASFVDEIKKSAALRSRRRERVVEDELVSKNGDHFSSSENPSPEMTEIPVVISLRPIEDDMVAVNARATIEIDVDKGHVESDHLKITVTSSDDKILPSKLIGRGKNGFTIEFTPKEVGAYDISVSYRSDEARSSPLRIKAYDARQVKVGDAPKAVVNRPANFTVDASNAGEGNLEITVSVEEETIVTDVQSLGNAKFKVGFVPSVASTHVVEITFNSRPVPGSPFEVDVGSDVTDLVSVDAQMKSTIGKTSSFTVGNIIGSISDFNVRVKDPKGTTIPSEIKEGEGGSYKVDFSPNTTGDHLIDIDIDNVGVSGSPFICKVYDVGRIKVRDIPRGIIGKPVTFLVETASAGPGNLEVTVDGGQVPTKAHAQGSNLYAISFVPQHKYLHVIDLKFNGESVPGSPFSCIVMESEKTKATASGDGLEKVAVNRPASFIVDLGNDPPADELSVKVTPPSGQDVPVRMNGSADKLFRVEYNPIEVGDHTINISCGEIVVSGSPFLVKAYDPSKVKVTDVSNGIVGKPVYFSIDASQAGAGNLEIIVSVNGRNVPNYVQSEGNAKFRVHFKPTDAQQHVLSVKFNGEPVPGSPYYCQVNDTSGNYVVSGASLRIASVSKLSKFTIDTRGVDKSECKALITAPSGKLVPSKIDQNSDKFEISFSPGEVGPHSIVVTLDGESISGSPFTCNVYDVDKINITGLESTVVGIPITFQVDASQAGEGTLELVVTTQKTSVRAEVAARSRGLYDVTFTPQDYTPHYVNITFNDEKVPGTPFRCDVSSSRSVVARGEGLKHGSVGSPSVFEIDARGIEGTIDVGVVGPDDIRVSTTISKTPSGTYRAEYEAKMVGTYKVNVIHSNKSISGKPFLVEVCDPSRIKIVDVADGLTDQEQSFRVDTSKAGKGNLEARIVATETGREENNAIREIGNGQYEVLWTPKMAVRHQINIFYNSRLVTGCPYDVTIKDSSRSIVASGAGLRSTAVSKTSTFVIDTKGYGDGKDFDVIVAGPKEGLVPVKCYQQKDGNLLAEFSPIHAGVHKIDILHANQPISGSPYSCQVYDASKVKIEKLESTSSKVNRKITFSLSRREAGYAELDVTVTSPLGKNLPFELTGANDGESINFTPTVAGKYKIAIKYGGSEVPGSPITFMVEETETAKVYGDGLLFGMQDEAVTFKMDVEGMTGEPHVQVDGPDSVAKCTLEQDGESAYLVTYIPREVGLFDIRVFWNGRELNGSPFHPKITNPAKVRVIGGLDSLMDDQNRLDLTLNEEKKIPFDISEAGPGKLRAEVRGPSGMIESALDQTNVHRFKLSFTPTEEGEFFIYLYYADAALPRTPYVGYAKPLTGSLDHTRVTLRGHGIASASVGEEADFVIDGSEAGPGSPEVSMSGVKADVAVTIVPLGNNIYRASYTPNVSGSYLLNITWSDRQVKGCPLKVAVTALSDASKVACSGDGLRGGQYGKEIKSYIDTRRAGPGELTAQCVGPHKVAYCELYDHRDGTFTLYIKPQEGGRHILTIKYGGENVEGSPFNLRIAGPPDASKVRVYGPGIEPGVLAVYQSRFISDTRGAGAGQLTVRIRGPKGAFRVEMQRESQKDRTILCKYDPTEPGDYRVEVKWSGEHVPGSPFLVMIFDTQEELNRYVQGAPNPSTPNSEFFRGNGYGTSFGQMSWKGSQTLS